MSVHVYKKAIRALGISESFVKGVSERSILAGVVMRGDISIDGFTISRATVGGMDTTEKIIEMYRSLKRNDINLLLLNGCVISWYNVIDLYKVFEETGRPLICVTYEESKGLEEYFKELFPQDWQQRVEIYHKNGPRIPLKLHTDFIVYVRSLGMSKKETEVILNRFTLQGAVPEPLRVSRLLARSLMRSISPEPKINS